MFLFEAPPGDSKFCNVLQVSCPLWRSAGGLDNGNLRNLRFFTAALVRPGGYGSPGSPSPWIGATRYPQSLQKHQKRFSTWVAGGTEKIADKALSRLLSVFAFKGS